MVDDCFTEMFSQWLERSTPSPSWSELKEALSSPVIGRGDIAKEITENVRIHTTESNTASQGLFILKPLSFIMSFAWGS